VKTAQMASALLVPLSGAGCGRCAERQRTAEPLSGGTVTALCSDGTSHAERGMAPSGVSARTTVAVRWITCMGPGPSTESDVVPSMSPARKGGCAEGMTSSLQLRCKRIESFAPARSVSCLRSAPQADVDCNRSGVSERAHPACCSHLPAEPQGSCGGSAAATRSNAPSSDVTVVPGGIPAPSGAGPSSETLTAAEPVGDLPA